MKSIMNRTFGIVLAFLILCFAAGFMPGGKRRGE